MSEEKATVKYSPFGFSERQVKQLLYRINPERVLEDGKGFSHVSQQDILAHLIRIFGFGGFDIDIKNVEMVFEEEVTKGKWNVCYKALVRLTVRNEAGIVVCHYENGSMETANNQKRGDAHDLAYKSAISLSVKRCAIALGDQFGLSLYNKGQLDALVRQSIPYIADEPAKEGEAKKDVQDGVPKQVALGNDEIDRTAEEEQGDDNTAAPKKTEKPAETHLSDVAIKALQGSYGLLLECETFQQLDIIVRKNIGKLDNEFPIEGGEITTLRKTALMMKGRLEAKQ